MTRRRFAFWLGFGLFSLAEKFRVSGLDALAAAAMRRTEPTKAKQATKNAATKKAATPVHWRYDDDETWRWFERESFVDGEWKPTGITRPVHKSTGERKAGEGDYLDDDLVPAEMQTAEHDGTANFTEPTVEFSHHQATATRRARHGRPPSKWLRSLNADELRIWLKTIKVPEAGVSGMTVWTHLTRDHSFDAKKIDGLTEPEQFKLHAAAHYGY